MKVTCSWLPKPVMSPDPARAGGVLFLEHGYEQAALVKQFFLNYGYHTLLQHKDLAGHKRVTSGKWH